MPAPRPNKSAAFRKAFHKFVNDQEKDKKRERLRDEREKELQKKKERDRSPNNGRQYHNDRVDANALGRKRHMPMPPDRSFNSAPPGMGFPSFGGPHHDPNFEGPNNDPYFDGPDSDLYTEGPYREPYPNRGPGFRGPTRGPDSQGPSWGPDFRGPPGPNRDFRGPNRDPYFEGPNRNPYFEGPNRDPYFEGPNRDSNFEGPSRGPRFQGPNQGPPGFRGPNEGHGYRGPNQGPNLQGLNRDPYFEGPNMGPDFRGPNREPGFQGPSRGPDFRGPPGHGRDFRGANMDPHFEGPSSDPYFEGPNRDPLFEGPPRGPGNDGPFRPAPNRPPVRPPGGPGLLPRSQPPGGRFPPPPGGRFPPPNLLHPPHSRELPNQLPNQMDNNRQGIVKDFRGGSNEYQKVLDLIRDYDRIAPKPAPEEPLSKDEQEKRFHEKWLYGSREKSDKSSKNFDDNIQLIPVTETFHVEPVDVRVLKKMIIESVQSYNEMETLCEKNARFHFYKRTMGNEFVQANVAKKVDDRNPLIYCKICHLRFSEPYKLDNHIVSFAHQQIAKLSKEFCKLGTQWFESYTYGGDCKYLPEEENGLKVEMVKRMKDFSKAEIAITDDFYSEFDLSQYVVADFIKKACHKRMKLIWPQTESPHFCSTCNYAEFDTQEGLERHYKSEKHIESQRTYNEAFCDACQHHFGVKEELKKHQQTTLHRRADKLLQEIRIHATKYWNLYKTHQIEGKQDVKKLAPTTYKQSATSFSATLHPTVFEVAATSEEKSQSSTEAMKLDKTYERLFQNKPDEHLLVENFITNSGCQVCNKEFIPTDATRESHIRSKKHQKNFRKYLRENKDEFLTPGGCVLCQQSFPCTEEIIITSHRLSKKHVANRKAYFFGKGQGGNVKQNLMKR